jgi:hypothetical protein
MHAEMAGKTRAEADAYVAVPFGNRSRAFGPWFDLYQSALMVTHEEWFTGFPG